MNLIGVEAFVFPIEAVLKMPVGPLALLANLNWVGPVCVVVEDPRTGFVRRVASPGKARVPSRSCSTGSLVWM
jgi:hypothetical protein